MRAVLQQNVAWLALFVLAVFRPGVGRFDRALVRPCWGVPSMWHAVADAAIRTRAVDPILENQTAPWRQASVPNPYPPRLAVVTVSDLRQSRVTVLDESYRVRGLFERVTADPALVTDETRGFKPLSHLWPIRDWNRDGRLETLIAFSPTRSGLLKRGTFAFIALGAEANELLFACELRSRRGNLAVLEQGDGNNDGLIDLAIVARGTETTGPLAVFTWNATTRSFAPASRPTLGALASYWCTQPGERVSFSRHIAVDVAIHDVLEAIRGGSAR
jgi:hypothetical protein